MGVSTSNQQFRKSDVNNKFNGQHCMTLQYGLVAIPASSFLTSSWLLVCNQLGELWQDVLDLTSKL